MNDLNNAVASQEEPIHMIKGRDTLCGVSPFTNRSLRDINYVTCEKCLAIYEVRYKNKEGSA